MAFLLIKNSSHDASHSHCIHSWKIIKGSLRVIHETKWFYLPLVNLSSQNRSKQSNMQNWALNVNITDVNAKQLMKYCLINEPWKSIMWCGKIILFKQNEKKLGASEEIVFSDIFMTFKSSTLARRIQHFTKNICLRIFFPLIARVLQTIIEKQKVAI